MGLGALPVPSLVAAPSLVACSQLVARAEVGFCVLVSPVVQSVTVGVELVLGLTPTPGPRCPAPACRVEGALAGLLWPAEVTGGLGWW